MAQYHVGCGLFEIYAGTLKKNGEEWLNKSNVTDEAIKAVTGYMYFKIPDGETKFGYGMKMRDGNWVRLIIEVVDEEPEWKEGQDDE